MSALTSNISDQQNCWDVIDKKFSSLTSEDAFWSKTARQLPFQVKSEIELKTQVVSFYHKVKNDFDQKKSAFEKARAELKIKALDEIDEPNRISKLWSGALTDAIDDRSYQPIADNLYNEMNECEARLKKMMDELLDSRENFAKEPIVQLFSHCILVANEKANLSRLHNANWENYFSKK